jgi:HEAT repeat protein
LEGPSLVALLRLGSSQYRKLVARTALRRASRDQLARNAAVALGNSGSSEAIAPLFEAAKEHRSEQVRAHATWALGHLLRQFGHEIARPHLEELRGSPSLSVAEEALVALQS